MDHIIRALKATGQDQICSLFWQTEAGDLKLYVNCNDVFWWGCADAEEITAENIALFETAMKDAGDDGGLLFCARARSLRPQGAIYKCISKENWHLFDECGPEREVDFGNPEEHP